MKRSEASGVSPTEPPGRLSIFDTEVFAQSRTLSNLVWEAVQPWAAISRDTVGTQWIRSTDNIGANLVEGDGHGSDSESLRFFVVSRASLRESQYWLLLAADRHLVAEIDHERLNGQTARLDRLLDGLISYRKRALEPIQVRDSRSTYDAEGDDLVSPLSE